MWSWPIGFYPLPQITCVDELSIFNGDHVTFSPAWRVCRSISSVRLSITFDQPSILWGNAVSANSQEVLSSWQLGRIDQPLESTGTKLGIVLAGANQFSWNCAGANQLMYYSARRLQISWSMNPIVLESFEAGKWYGLYETSCLATVGN